MNDFKRKTILLVEDEAITAIVEKKDLNKYGYDVIHALTGEEAIELISEEKEPVDLILMDIDLGSGLDGTETVKIILKDNNIPVVFLSSHNEPEIVEKTEKITSYGYVDKQSSIAVLDASIKMAFKLFDAKIREHKKEEALKESEGRLKDNEQKSRAWLENSTVCTKIVDLDFNLQYMSSAGIKDLKIDDITQFYGKPYPLDFYPDSFKIPMVKNLRKVRETGLIITQEASIVSIEGNELWYHSTLVPVNDDEGRIDYIMVISLETTERKKAEDELNKYHNNLEKMVKERTVELEREITERKQAEDKLIQEKEKLKDALAKIKKLSGMLPICASCKKIRDDKGYWNQIEGYIENHSDALFSHGVCPECMEELYSDQDWYKKKKK